MPGPPRTAEVVMSVTIVEIQRASGIRLLFRFPALLWAAGRTRSAEGDI